MCSRQLDYVSEDQINNTPLPSGVAGPGVTTKVWVIYYLRALCACDGVITPVTEPGPNLVTQYPLIIGCFV